MKIVKIDKDKFDIKNIKGEITYPKQVILKMANEILGTIILSNLKNYDEENIFSIIRNNKKIELQVYQFSLSDYTDETLFSELKEEDIEQIIVYGLSFIENDEIHTDINKESNYLIVLGFLKSEENRALFRVGTNSMQFARIFIDDIIGFLADNDPVVDAILESLPSDSNVLKKNAVSLIADIPVNDYNIRLLFSNKRMIVTIPHKYTDYEDVYGMRFTNTSKTERFETVEDVKKYNWGDLWNYMYENRHGVCSFKGYSLGT